MAPTDLKPGALRVGVPVARPGGPTEDRATPTTLAAADRPDRDGVQGMVYAGFGALRTGRFVFARIVDAGATRAWLGRVLDQVTGAPAAGERFEAETACQLALTAHGFAALGVDPVAAGFSRPFTEGIVTPHRSRLLGDEGANDPATWRWGGPAHPVDVLVLLYARDGAGVDALAGSLGLGAGAGGFAGTGLEEVASVGTQIWSDDGREHFGFKDGISQPRFAGEEGMSDPADRTWSLVAPGEFVLGAVDQANQRVPIPAVAGAPGPELGRNGSYLVVRQLRQDVAGFRRWTLDAAHGDEARARAIAEKVVGRRADGTPLVAHGASGQNDFGFATDDPWGEGCPIGSHVRRANPRDGRGGDEVDAKDASDTLANTKRHRILRRGRAYGEPLPEGVTEDDGADRGLLFVALNADLERQFEFVQHHWLNSATFARAGEIDPLVGRNDNGTFGVPVAGSVRERHHGLPQFVTVVGGEYFFLPSLPALAALAATR